MPYTVKKLAELAGVSPRTLRYYDKIGLLRPGDVTPAGYRLYGGQEVDRLQHILFYRELGLGLAEIGRLLDDSSYDRLGALQGHLKMLEQQKAHIQGLIRTVKKTIEHEKGEREMMDAEKFEGFKERLVQENEALYGAESRKKYGGAAVEGANGKLRGLSRKQYDAMEALSRQILQELGQAVRQGLDPAGGEGRRLALLHREWLSYTWPRYSAQAHRGLAEVYAQDGRFTAYYDREVPGCAAFLRDAVMHHIG